MIPLKDENPTKNRCYLRYVILFICLVVFFFQISSSQSNLITYYFYVNFDFISNLFLEGIKVPQFDLFQ